MRLRQQCLHSRLSPLPSGTGLRQFGGACLRDRDHFLTAIVAAAHYDPVGVREWAEVARERRFVQ